MSVYDGNYGEHWERDVLEALAVERDRDVELMEWEQEQRADRLRRDDPVRLVCAVDPYPFATVGDPRVEVRIERADEAGDIDYGEAPF